ncbi:MAG: hypothetical protein U0984_02405 [Prosthecobacter sp.]|nr:hypothetical protein [Prosthecobacter sp.]
MKRLVMAVTFSMLGLATAGEPWVYLDNGQVRLGVNLAAGACVGWFSASGSTDNVLNAYDAGRYVQQSYYGDADGSDWNGKPWRYNPVQGGSWRNEPSVVLESKVEKESLYAKIRPRHWATGQLLDEVMMEEWLRLDGARARLKFRMTYTGAKAHTPRHQELPALFVRSSLDTLVFVDAEKKLTRGQPGFPNEYVKLGEPWAAWVDGSGRGVGIWCPHAQEATCYRVRNGDKGDCSYLAPLQTFALQPGLVFEYEAVLMIGSVEEMRDAFRRLAVQPRGSGSKVSSCK